MKSVATHRVYLFLVKELNNIFGVRTPDGVNSSRLTLLDYLHAFVDKELTVNDLTPLFWVNNIGEINDEYITLYGYAVKGVNYIIFKFDLQVLG